MPAPKKTKMSDAFLYLSNEASSFSETNDCAVKALSMVCQQPYANVHAVLKDLGRQDGRGTRNADIYTAVKSMNRTYADLNMEKIIKDYPKAHRVLKNVTTHHPERFPEFWGDTGLSFLFWSKRHVSGLYDGKLHDWAVGRALRCWRLTVVWERGTLTERQQSWIARYSQVNK